MSGAVCCLLACYTGVPYDRLLQTGRPSYAYQHLATRFFSSLSHLGAAKTRLIATAHQHGMGVASEGGQGVRCSGCVPGVYTTKIKSVSTAVVLGLTTTKTGTSRISRGTGKLSSCSKNRHTSWNAGAPSEESTTAV